VPAPTQVICFLGRSLDVEHCGMIARDVGGPGFELDLEYSAPRPDPRMPKAFRYSMDLVDPSFEPDDWAAIDAHDSVLYLMSPPVTPATALQVTRATLRVTAALLRSGATAAKNESCGLAHGRDRWLSLADEAEKAAPGVDLAAVLHCANVRRPIGAGDVLYSCGMHLLGRPDVEVPAGGPELQAVRWLDALAGYLLAELPPEGIHDGEGFRLVADGQRRVLRHRPCDRYPDDDFFHNPYGYWRLVDPD
jgi:hypothetical protein